MEETAGQIEKLLMKVRGAVDVKLERQDSRQNTLQIVIRGQLWSQPVPLELLLAADLDVETGHTRVRELK